MKATDQIKAIRECKEDAALSCVYAKLSDARERCIAALDAYVKLFSDEEIGLFTAPGRTEVGGNHTDHNHGTVIAAAVELDMLAVAAPENDGSVELYSEGYGWTKLNISSLAVEPSEAGTPAALIRGVAAAMKERGYNAGGFRAYVTSDVPGGLGLSSSAAFEVLIACILSHLYNGGRVTPTEAAIMGRYAENMYFGKPCGLMDQTACAVGGFICIDFQDPQNPAVRPVPQLAGGYALCIVDTRADHEGLTQEYAAMPGEMHAVARELGGKVLRDVTEAALYENAARVRFACGDRAFLRAAHFFREDARAREQADMLQNGDTDAFLALVRESGRSSYMYLQNVYTAADSKKQPVAAALCLSDHLLQGRGAFRVHGGGLAGTIQAWVPNDILEEYRAGMDAVFGPGSCAVPGIRKTGIAKIL